MREREINLQFYEYQIPSFRQLSDIMRVSAVSSLRGQTLSSSDVRTSITSPIGLAHAHVVNHRRGPRLVVRPSQFQF